MYRRMFDVEDMEDEELLRYYKDYIDCNCPCCTETDMSSIEFRNEEAYQYQPDAEQDDMNVDANTAEVEPNDPSHINHENVHDSSHPGYTRDKAELAAEQQLQG